MSEREGRMARPWTKIIKSEVGGTIRRAVQNIMDMPVMLRTIGAPEGKIIGEKDVVVAQGKVVRDFGGERIIITDREVVYPNSSIHKVVEFSKSE